MYLIRAEAKAGTGGLAGAAEDLNTRHSNRITNATVLSFGLTEENNDAILLAERFGELWPTKATASGIWKRKGPPVERQAEDAPDGNATTLPIPQSELDANPEMQ